MMDIFAVIGMFTVFIGAAALIGWLENLLHRFRVLETAVLKRGRK